MSPMLRIDVLLTPALLALAVACTPANDGITRFDMERPSGAGASTSGATDARPGAAAPPGSKGAPASFAPSESSLLVEPLGNPRLRFADGEVVDNAPAMFPGTPAIPGVPDSAWYVAQWKKTALMRPDVVFESSPDALDPALGKARWAFPTTDNQSHLWIWEPAGGPRVFELYGEHGWLDPGGGSNVLLAVDAVDEASTTMDRPVRLTMSAKIARSGVAFAVPEASTDGSVTWQVFTGLDFHFVPPGGGPRINLFLQIAHADSRNADGTYLAFGDGSALYGGRLPGTPSLYGDEPTGALVPLDIDVNAYLCDAATRSYPTSSGAPFTFPPEAKDLANWRFKSLYTGIETQDRLGSSTAPPRGSDFVAYHVAALDVRKQPSGPVVSCP